MQLESSTCRCSLYRLALSRTRDLLATPQSNRQTLAKHETMQQQHFESMVGASPKLADAIQPAPVGARNPLLHLRVLSLASFLARTTPSLLLASTLTASSHSQAAVLACVGCARVDVLVYAGGLRRHRMWRAFKRHRFVSCR
eukprot:6188627-Pleurochrysis_carterae.AAC.1